MDLSFKPCSSIAATTTGSLREVRNRGDSLLLDRLSSLPIELLIRILSLLPTKDAAATCLLSKKLRRVFPWITSLDFDDSSISYCLSRPSRVERFPSYVTFVDSVLQEYQSQHLTRFRLQVGGHSRPRVLYLPRYNDTKCDLDCAKSCYPHLSSTQIFAWISLPLTRHGLRELDLSIHVSEEGDSQLPPDIFVCETLELLKLDINLGLDLVSTMPSFKLPNLKLLHLIAIFISGDGFVTRLVSSCPLLEDLYVNAGYNHVHSTVISSPSLRRLHYSVTYFLDECDNPENMLINTPNLEYFKYIDNLASRYTISKMDSLVIAILDIGNILEWDEREVSFQQLVNLIRPLSNAQHLLLGYASTTALNFVELKDLLPVFRNLEYLELDGCVDTFWDKILMAFLHCCPVLKSLVFTRGLDLACNLKIPSSGGYLKEQLDMEHEFCITALANIPWCCRFNLKRIVVKRFVGTTRDYELLQFLLKHALVLEELVIGPTVANRMTCESTLPNLPRASASCSIQFH